MTFLKDLIKFLIYLFAQLVVVVAIILMFRGCER